MEYNASFHGLRIFIAVTYIKCWKTIAWISAVTLNNSVLRPDSKFSLSFEMHSYTILLEYIDKICSPLKYKSYKYYFARMQ